MSWHVRPFAERDYPRLVELDNAVYPELGRGEAEFRHQDASWDHERYFFRRCLAEEADGAVAGWGTLHHMPDQFDPDRYGFSIGVHPDARRRGAGSALYDALRRTLIERGARAARAEAKASQPAGGAFLERRGFVERARAWESILDVAAFDPTPFAGAPARVAAQGITLSTLAEERARDPAALTAIFDLFLVCSRDVPEIDPVTDVPYDYFLTNEVEGPDGLPDGFFLAKDGGRYVALSNLYSSERDPSVIHQGLTGVHPAYRGRGLAMALKLRTVEYARDRGKRQIRTWNNTLNRPMLRINEAMGFRKEPVWVVYQKELAGDEAASSPLGAGA